MDYIAENDYRYATNLLIRANEQYWYPNSGITKDEGWIYVLHDVHVRFSLCILEDLVAKGLQERERLPIAGIISGRKDYLMEMVDQIDKSFDIEQSFCPSYRDYNSPEIEKKAEELASETYGDKRKLIELTYRNVPFGDVLYDDILRGGDVRNRGKIFSCFDMSQEQYRGFIRNALAAIDQAYEIFTAMPPCYLVTTEYFYTKGLYAHVAKALGAKIIITSIDFPDIVTWVNSDHGALSEIKVADMIRAKMEKCLAGYQTNERTPENLFVVDMKSAKKEGQILGLKNGKKKCIYFATRIR